jgi:hypothetical protein
LPTGCGLLDALPVMVGLLPFSLVSGTQASQKGHDTVEVPSMTGLDAPAVRRSPPLPRGRSRRTLS